VLLTRILHVYSKHLLLFLTLPSPTHLYTLSLHDALPIFDRRPDPRKELVDGGRSINLALSARGLKALDEHGLADTIRRIAIPMQDRKSTRLNSSHVKISYAVFCLKKKKNQYVI